MPALSLVAILILSILLQPQSQTASAAEQKTSSGITDTWYLGKGAKPGLYMIWRIQDNSVNNGRPFNMSVIFSAYDQIDNYWVGGIWAHHGIPGKYTESEILMDGNNLAIVNNTQQLQAISDYNPYLLRYLNAAGHASPELGVFLPAYSKDLLSLSTIATKSENYTLTTQSPWITFQPADENPPSVGPVGNETIIVPAGTYNTTIIAHYQNAGKDVVVSDKIWINKDLPFPVKQYVFSHPLPYSETATDRLVNGSLVSSFELIKTGIAIPCPPAGLTGCGPHSPDIPVQSLKQQTEDGKYTIELSWRPAVIFPENTTDFVVNVYYDTGLPVLSGKIHMKIEDANGTVIRDLGLHAINSNGTTSGLPVILNRTGSFNVAVTVYPPGCNQQCVESGNENVTIGVVVAPEFNSPAAGLIMASIVGIISTGMAVRYRSRFYET